MGRLDVSPRYLLNHGQLQPRLVSCGIMGVAPDTYVPGARGFRVGIFLPVKSSSRGFREGLNGLVEVRRERAEVRPVELEETHQYLVKHDIKGGLTVTLLASRALEKGIPISGDSKRRLTMKVGNRSVWFDGARSNLNDLLARRCTRYKDVTSRLLLNRGVRAPENIAFGHHQLDEAWSWASHQTPVVVKPPNEGMGSSVHIGISEFTEFEAAFKDVASQSDYVLVERFVEGVEHRVLLVYGKVAAAARRVPANVIGDGSSTVAELIEEKNRQRTASQNPVHYQIPVDDVVVKELKKSQLTLESVPEDGQQVWLRPNSNVHSGETAWTPQMSSPLKRSAWPKTWPKPYPACASLELTCSFRARGKG